MTSSPSDVIVVGGGVIGCSIAYFLARAGVRVTVVEGEQVGAAGATYASAGLLEPLSDSVLPGPMTDLALRSFRMFPEFLRTLQEESDFEVEYRTGGRLRVALNEEEARGLKDSVNRHSELGLKLEWLDGDEAQKLEPLLSECVWGARLSPDEHQLSATRLAEALKRACLRRGGVFQEHTPVLGFLRDNANVLGVHTPQGDLPSEHVILAAGSWTGLFERELQVSLPISPVRGQVLYLAGLPRPLRFSVEGPHGYAIPKGELVLAGTTVEHVGFDLRVTAGGVFSILQGVRQFLPSVDGASIHHTRAGFRPWAPDALPILGPVPGVEGLSVASGHFRSGILLAPITGQLIADSLTGHSQREVLEPFSPARFLLERSRATSA